ncbi:hypothetical protein PR003_g14187 [Phytophthora rubi]|uniref:RxLR effector protein n=1 Tax=Phytophthora rubi TaxID=129364 RepID=A0A6A3L6D4_9STRA|nr:hypothetical protein PR001_g15372 [Phytophthora rubi]KAE9016431.1 hypothetical protein PR002_g13661 [Phytophthora rubi]KAE9333115.1 hypothetical protein PR003_g14187 [Phytophthora rubi]
MLISLKGFIAVVILVRLCEAGVPAGTNTERARALTTTRGAPARERLARKSVSGTDPRSGVASS